VGAPAADLSNTTYLKEINSANAEGVFRGIPQGLVLGSLNSNAFDYYGNEVDTSSATGAPVVYCASNRLTWIYKDRLMRADVRVWWAVEGSGRDILSDFPSPSKCADDPLKLNPGGTLFGKYHVVYLSTAIRNLQYQ
jgi:hypothetical protein